jgi:hypothetical protein
MSNGVTGRFLRATRRAETGMSSRAAAIRPARGLGTLIYVAHMRLMPGLVAAALVVAACSSSGSSSSPTESGSTTAPSANKLMNRATTAMATATSVHLFGTTVAANGTVARADVRVSHTAAFGAVHAQGRTIRLRKVDGEFYFQANDAYWKASVPASRLTAFLRRVHGKWINVRPGDKPFTGILTFGSWESVTSLATKASNRNYEFGPTKVIHGIVTVSVVDAETRTTIVIPRQGPPLPLEIDAGPNRVSHFAAWNEPLHVAAPAPDQVIEAAQLLNKR